MNAAAGKLAFAALLAGGLALGGCATQPYGGSGQYGSSGQYGTTYSQSDYRTQSSGYGNNAVNCRNCGVVQEAQQVYTDTGSGTNPLGAVIGAVAGGVLGSTVGKGDGRKAAAVGGAVAGGVVGSQVGKQGSAGGTAWRIVVRMDDGRYATVTQRQNPGVRVGDYVEIRNDQVYPR